ncbi:hypothetical protein TorRG33x02_223940 [Trema orientale]|uniref:Uncharacterized protein n=1 Tax=Trema orientale TaxID=63057 RepID=A0A2P5E8A5_TREOI|nr:hypothetical protein TorRG33x02_223940 [Trema orientale]
MNYVQLFKILFALKSVMLDAQLSLDWDLALSRYMLEKACMKHLEDCQLIILGYIEVVKDHLSS